MEKSNKVPAPTSAYRNRGRAIAYLAFTLLTAGALLIALAPGKTEQKGELVKDNTKYPTTWMVHKEDLIEIRTTSEDYTIVASPVRGGAEHILYTLPRVNNNIGVPIFTETEIRLPVAEIPPTPPPPPPTPTPTATPIGGSVGGGVGGGGSTPPGIGGGRALLKEHHLGSFLPPEKAELIPQNAQQLPLGGGFGPIGGHFITYHRETLHHIPLDGSSVIKHAFEWKNSESVFYSENAAFAFRSKEKRDVRVILPNWDWFELRFPTYSLYSRPLTGGPERLVLSGLPFINIQGYGEESPDYSVDSTGVYMRLIHPYPDTSCELLRIPNPDGSPIRIPDYQSKDLPVVYKERLWWLESKTALDAQTAVTTKLVSCRLDGADRQTYLIENDPDGKKAIAERLLNCDGALILLYQREEEFRSDGASERIMRNYCARLYPDRTELFSKPLRLPESKSSFTPEHCADGYFYYFVENARNSPLDFLQEKSTTHMVTSLSRVRLPE